MSSVQLTRSASYFRYYGPTPRAMLQVVAAAALHVFISRCRDVGLLRCASFSLFVRVLVLGILFASRRFRDGSTEPRLVVFFSGATRVEAWHDRRLDEGKLCSVTRNEYPGARSHVTLVASLGLIFTYCLLFTFLFNVVSTN